MSPSHIDANDLAAALHRREAIAVLDVREMGEYRQRHLLGCTPLPLGDLRARVRRYVPDASLPIVVCGVGDGREEQAAAQLSGMGFSDVAVLAGALGAWTAQGLPTGTGWGFEGKQFGEEVGVRDGIPQASADELAGQCGQADAIVLDSRTAPEFEKGHLPGAVWLPAFASVLHAADVAGRYRVVYVNCAGRTRSILGARLLRQMGFDNVFAVENGTWGWIHSGRKLEKGAGRRLDAPSAQALEAAERHAAALAAQRGVHTVEAPAWSGAGRRARYVVDIREVARFRLGHVPGAFHVEGSLLQFHAEERFAVRALPVLVVGERSADGVAAAALLRELGYDASALTAGFDAWKAAGLPVEQGDEAWTDREPAARAVAPEPLAWQEAADRIQRGAVLLDVRALGEFALGHVAGSRHLALGCLVRDLAQLDRGRLHVVAGNGRKALRAAEVLAAEGFGVVVLHEAVEDLPAAGIDLVEGVGGASATIDEAKEDVDPFRRRGSLRQTVAESHAYLEWESALSHGVSPATRAPTNTL